MPVFHALTENDTVSPFGGRGKKTAWNTWQSFPKVIEAFLVYKGNAKCYRRWCTLYLYYWSGLSCCCMNAQVTKWESTMPISTCFPKLQELLRIFNRLKQHWCSKSSEPCIKQESGTRPYFQIHMQLRVLPTEDGSPVVLVWHHWWTTLPEVSGCCYELIRCGCKKCCTGRCSCVKPELRCIALCSCSDEC